MTNEEKINEIGNSKPINWISDEDLCTYQQGLRRGAFEMAEWKDAQLREQEKRLLDVFETVLNLSARTQEGYDFAMTLFRNELINEDI